MSDALPTFRERKREKHFPSTPETSVNHIPVPKRPVVGCVIAPDSWMLPMPKCVACVVTAVNPGAEPSGVYEYATLVDGKVRERGLTCRPDAIHVERWATEAEARVVFAPTGECPTCGSTVTSHRFCVNRGERVPAHPVGNPGPGFWGGNCSACSDKWHDGRA